MRWDQANQVFYLLIKSEFVSFLWSVWTDVKNICVSHCVLWKDHLSNDKILQVVLQEWPANNNTVQTWTLNNTDIQMGFHQWTEWFFLLFSTSPMNSSWTNTSPLASHCRQSYIFKSLWCDKESGVVFPCSPHHQEYWFTGDWRRQFRSVHLGWLWSITNTCVYLQSNKMWWEMIFLTIWLRLYDPALPPPGCCCCPTYTAHLKVSERLRSGSNHICCEFPEPRQIWIRSSLLLMQSCSWSITLWGSWSDDVPLVLL